MVGTRRHRTQAMTQARGPPRKRSPPEYIRGAGIQSGISHLVPKINSFRPLYNNSLRGGSRDLSSTGRTVPGHPQSLCIERVGLHVYTIRLLSRSFCPTLINLLDRGLHTPHSGPPPPLAIRGDHGRRGLHVGHAARRARAPQRPHVATPDSGANPRPPSRVSYMGPGGRSDGPVARVS